MNGQHLAPGPPTPSWTFNPQTSSAQVLPGQFLPFISPGWQWHPGSLFFFLGWANSRGRILKANSHVCILMVLAGQPLVTIFDPKCYHLHTLYFVEFVPEETPRLENQYILMPPSSGVPSFHVPYPSTPQAHGQRRFRDLIPVAIAGTVALTVGALLDKAFKKPHQAVYGPPPIAPSMNFQSLNYPGAPYSMYNSFSASPASSQNQYLAPSYPPSHHLSSSRSSSSSPVARIRSKEPVSRAERIKELPDSSDEERTHGPTGSGTASKNTEQRPQSLPKYTKPSERRNTSKENDGNSSDQRPKTTPQVAGGPSLRRSRSQSSKIKIDHSSPPQGEESTSKLKSSSPNRGQSSKIKIDRSSPLQSEESTSKFKSSSPNQGQSSKLNFKLFDSTDWLERYDRAASDAQKLGAKSSEIGHRRHVSDSPSHSDPPTEMHNTSLQDTVEKYNSSLQERLEKIKKEPERTSTKENSIPDTAGNVLDMFSDRSLSEIRHLLVNPYEKLNILPPLSQTPERAARIRRMREQLKKSKSIASLAAANADSTAVEVRKVDQDGSLASARSRTESDGNATNSSSIVTVTAGLQKSMPGDQPLIYVSDTTEIGGAVTTGEDDHRVKKPLAKQKPQQDATSVPDGIRGRASSGLAGSMRLQRGPRTPLPGTAMDLLQLRLKASETNARRFNFGIPHALGHWTADILALQQQSRLSAVDSFLLDARTIETSQDETDKTRIADWWFKALSERVHDIVEPRRKERDRCVKIAILDTGIDLLHPLFKKHQDRIIKCKSFYEHYKGDEDSCGHGTHAAGLLLDVASNAHIYVARVFITGKESIGTAGRIAKAITWAVEECQVDIISMSFGFPQRDEGIREALVKAYTAGKLLFAAASNNGANESVAISFPARLSGLVICVNSTDGHGAPSSYNPPHTDDHANLSILGEAVKSKWPIHLTKGETRRSSGTSVSTPIMAGIAALIIEFARQGPSTINLEKLTHHDGMLLVLKSMAEKKNGYNYVRPWHLLTHDRERTRAEISMMISNILKQL
ncbi:MAG: hypothetical protein Q9181_003757 [Wetmoreana brouardii]